MQFLYTKKNGLEEYLNIIESEAKERNPDFIEYLKCSLSLEEDNPDYKKEDIDYPEEFLSARSISRRIKHNVMIQWNDLPVDPVYIDSMKSLGLQILNISKWFNAITVESIDIELIDTITNISFISLRYS